MNTRTNTYLNSNLFSDVRTVGQPPQCQYLLQNEKAEQAALVSGTPIAANFAWCVCVQPLVMVGVAAFSGFSIAGE